MASGGDIFEFDALDLRILEDLISDAMTTFKELAIRNKIDQRTIASRFEKMVKCGVIRKATLDVDWSRLGLKAHAIMGTRTSMGDADRKRLFDRIQREPRIVECYATIGAYEYVLEVMDRDIVTIRSEIGAPLEPLTAGIVTSIVTGLVKGTDYSSLMNYLRKTTLKQAKRM
ncbi:MAG: Lrp/AsnC family transcriptional regulator [archaeon]